MTSFPAQVLIPAGFPQLQLLRPAEQRYTQIYEGCKDVSAQRNTESLSNHIWLLSNCTSQLSSASSVGISMCESKAKNMSRFLFSGQFNLALLLLRCLLLPNCEGKVQMTHREESISEKLRGSDLQALSPVPRRSLVELTFRRQPDARLEFHFTLLTLNAFLKWPQRCSFNRNPAFSSAGCSRCRHQCSLVV